MRGHVRKREGKRGVTWCFVLELERGPDNKRRQQWKSGFATRKAAQQALTLALRQVETGEYVGATKTTFGGLLDRWMQDVIRPNRTPATATTYDSLIRNHVKPELGAVLLDKLTPAAVQHFLAERQEQALSASTVTSLRAICVASLNFAVKWGLVGRNAAGLTEGPGAPEPEAPVFSAEQIRAIFAAVEETELLTPALVAALLGLRRGEVLGLRWADLDFERGILHVRQALKDRSRAGGGCYFGPPKTKKSRRAVLLFPLLVELLRQHRADQAGRRLLAGEEWQDHNLVFPAANGRAWPPHALSNGWTRRMRRAGITCRFHDLRHVNATVLLAAGVPLKVLSERLGHSRASETLDRYAHLMAGQQGEAAAVAEKAFRGLLEGL